MRFQLFLLGLLAIPATQVFAQPVPGGREGSPREGGRKSSDVPTMVARIMAFDADKDGKVTRAELTDERLAALFDRADANKDGVVTKEELTALFTKESASGGRTVAAPDGAGPQDGPPREGGPRDGAPREGGPRDGAPREGAPRDGAPREGGPRDGVEGGRPARGLPGQPGQILPAFFQTALKLTDEQKKQVADLQKEVDTKLQAILTEEQKAQYKQMKERGPGGREGGPREGAPRDGAPRDGGTPPEGGQRNGAPRETPRAPKE